MEVQINVPSTLNEIPLKHYQDFLKVQRDSTDEEFVAQKMVEIFCGIRLIEVAKIKLTSLNELIAHFTQLFNQVPKFTPKFMIGDIEFGFIPELEDITFGEYVDLDSHLQSWDKFHKAMAVLYRPIKTRSGDKYEIAEYNPSKDMEELMQYAPLDVCIAASVFFWTLESDLLQATLNYLETEMKKEKSLSQTLAKQLNLANDGDGISHFMHSLKEMSQGLTISPSQGLLNVLPISPSKNKKTKSNKDNLKDN
jgi:hypothetical protein